MADQNAITDGVRVSMTENLAKLRKASADYFQMMEGGLASSHFPTTEHARQYFDYLQRNVMGTFDLCDKLTQAKDLQDVMRSQSEFFQAQMRLLTDQANRIGDATRAAMTAALAPKH